ncbi:MAG: translation elongation factor Ts [Corynebacterium casei]|uniref:Elongation factor Ts n=2 Tax=Corynebacterium casei TaxID=160386 RepID=G7HVD3_9CORY|nr:translation elongation factor Ts [Corynebacterium casei]AHI19783.1 elongation factor Ts [Corynebacterium casei LMG S-19264]MDN5706656.1 translation elongation factor Ts [Corynebacterium casei]MDN5728286.1 translation elongation factor Ts [Corynebacterium casei]MDN5740494.1 translation elongation factor Ts [Corynebacterium casei]MDN5785142.1 translation elongation factor Ts [Corynebacterium casei]
MANYTAADVKALREATGSGMLDCKKALEEAGGDYDKAVEILRIKGAKSVSKRADREATEGLIAVSGNTMVEINCETDFVAKNADFRTFADKIVEAAGAAKANSAEELNAVQIDGKDVATLIDEESAKIGEKLQARRAVTVEGDNVAVYLHQRSADLPPAVGVLVSYEGDAEAARAVAMQVAAMKAEYLTREEVPAEIVEKEREIAEATTREEGKPEAALPKIVEGRLNGFYKSIVLLDQASLSDSKKTVKQVAEEAGTTITGFQRYEVGA